MRSQLVPSDLLSVEKRDWVRRSLQENLHRYFVGQVILSSILAVLYSIAFFILQVPYSLLFGFSIGVLGLIPFGDTLAYLLICLFLAAQSPQIVLPTLIVCVILDQVVDQAIAPRILSNMTGLKPIWVILALLLGTKLFGLPGLLLAVPTASFMEEFLANRFPENIAVPENGTPENGTVDQHGEPVLDSSIIQSKL
ncbi:MAG: AI-2E family transporter [Oculatellaceae cyanobacterium Prado106]|jgi:predicted PurR-regulated permease PerM|nr:AI-2E family transporter [Oculatellaceae cyanobacterium Prado106]